MNANAELAPAEPEGNLGRWLVLAVGLLTVLLAVLTVWTVTRPTGDLYVALAAGRDIMNGKLTALDDWAFTTGGRVWVNQNWGTHMLYYLFYRATGGRDGHVAQDEGTGEIGLLILKLLILLTGATCLACACRRRGANWPVALLVAAGIIAAGRSFIDLRPNLTTLMFVPVMLHLLYRTQDHPRRIWLAMVVFGLIWANLHGGFIFGLGTMGFWSLCLIVPELLKERLFRRLLLGVVWAVAAGLVAWAMAVEAGLRRWTIPIGAAAGLAVLAAHWAIVLLRARSRAAARPEEPPETLWPVLARRVGPRWQFVAATAGAIVLAGVVTPFGVHNLFRDYSVLKMRFWEIWNLGQPFVVMASGDKALWQSVIEWHSIFTASSSTFGTSWEFFSIVGLFSGLVSLHVFVKLMMRRRVSLEDIVLLAGIVILSIVVFVRARPIYQDFGPIVNAYKRNPALAGQLDGVLEQRGGWLAAMIVYPLLGLFAAGVGIGALGTVLVRRENLEPFTARQVGVMVFDVAMAAGGIFYLAFDARRFIPVSLILLAPLLARRMQWLLGALARAWPRIWSWALAAVITGLLAWGLVRLALGEEDPGLLWWLLLAPIVVVAAQLGLRLLGGLCGGGLTSPSWPTVLTGLALFALIGVQARENALRYWPTSPVVRYRSMLKNMIVYNMFPPNCRDFINDNDLTGRAFNEWRWEGYLRWYCPQLKMFLGGRAQQVYDADTYKLQRRILTGRESPGVLNELGVRWIVVPMNTGYNVLLRETVYDDTARWAPVFCDGENLVLANALLPECRETIERCLAGRLKYRDAALAHLSRGFCLSSRVVANVYVGRAKSGADPKAVRQQVAREAIAALKESQKCRPIFMAYAALSDLYKSTPVSAADETAYYEAEYRRLRAMDFNRLGGIEVLRCRQWVLEMLIDLYKATKQEDKQRQAEAEAGRVRGIFEDVLEKWR